nr:hypothetical protein K2Z90_004407 [Rhodococcus opacus PD630]
MCAVAAAVLGHSGRTVVPVSISMPDIRFAPVRVPEWDSWVVQTAWSVNGPATRTSRHTGEESG